MTWSLRGASWTKIQNVSQVGHANICGFVHNLPTAGFACAPPLSRSINQKKSNVRNFSVRNSRVGNGCANFHGSLEFLVFFLETSSLVFGGGGRGILGLGGAGGGKYRFFMGTGIFLNKTSMCCEMLII